MNQQEALEIVSYKLGLKNGKSALEDPVLIPEQIEQAIADSESGTPRQIDARSYMNATKVVKEVRLERARLDGEQWLKENAGKDDVVTTASGLQYTVVKEGEGQSCRADSTVEVDYKGSLLDGTVFDSSYDRGQSAEFKVKKVIQGWQEGLQLMTEGSEFRFFIPQELGYGDRGSGSSIPPYSVLIFDVVLRKVIE